MRAKQVLYYYIRFGTRKLHLSPPPPHTHTSGLDCCNYKGGGSVVVDSLFIVVPIAGLNVCLPVLLCSALNPF